ncbi:MAG: NgoFVII family restriction endonuclease [Patescibacteria group bacterium]|jgi:hypothetical protein
MFLNKQNKEQIDYYVNLLQVGASISNLFSDSSIPYIHYRYVENLFCKSFSARNLSRTDMSADASKETLGIGIKTFTYKSGISFEKVAEFDKDMATLRDKSVEVIVGEVAKLRNERIDATKRTFALEGIIYHCVVRKPGKLIVYETPMDKINLEKINIDKTDGGVINFHDDKGEYKIYLSKSTLLKKFSADKVHLEFNAEILKDPFSELQKLLSKFEEVVIPTEKEIDTIFLPLYSYKDGKPYVYPKSGLNIWHAGGRPRDLGEVYIPIPAWIHKEKSDFFPSRDTKFILIKPDGKEMTAKVCQDGSKALMSDPNNQLGQWLLRTVLGLNEGELLTYDKLEELGIDSVEITKISKDKYKINFTKTGSYEEFKDNIDKNELDSPTS